MKLSKAQKIGIGILTFMPILFIIGYIVLFFTLFFGTFNDLSNSSEGPPEHFFSSFFILFIFLALTLISGLIATVFHIIHIAKNPKLKQQNNGQLIWILIVLLVNGIGGIIYYFMEILPEPKDSIVDSND